MKVLLPRLVYSGIISAIIIGTTYSIAHSKEIDWTKSTLPPTGFTPQRDSSISRQGKSLYQTHNCSSCHQINGNGGAIGPPLDGIGGHRGEQFLTDRLLNPSKQNLEYKELFGGKPGLMPHTGINRPQAKAIAKYLLTLPEPKEGYFIQAHINDPLVEKLENNDTPSTKLGSELFLENGCAACHTTYDRDSRFGPSLAGISQRRSRQDVEKILNGKLKNKLMKKQTKRLDPQTVKCITDFLLKIPVKP